EYLRDVVPDPVTTRIEKRSREDVFYWRVVAEDNQGNRYSFDIGLGGQLKRISTVIDEQDESGGGIFHKEKIKQVPVEKIPEIILENAEIFRFGLSLTKAFSVEAVDGHRYFVQYGDEKEGVILSFTDEGELRSAGNVLSMLRPIIPPKIETLEMISENLSKYGDKYHVDKMIARIKAVSFEKSQGFRFVVVGDSRSNINMWQMVTHSINKWQPLFVINVGDLTRYGYSIDMDTYLFQTLEDNAPYPFLPVMGNHDCRRGSASYTYAFGGDGARVYHFDYGHSRFVILDNCDYQGVMPWKEQLALADGWLTEKKGYRKFVFVHYPPPEIEKWAYHAMPPEMSAPLLELMSKHQVDHVFFGHIHAYSTENYGGVDYTVTGGGGASLHTQYGEMGSHHHYVVVDVLKDKVEMTLVRFLPVEE
ncbi:MAG: metallophosphoesterase, partial [Deltaproteobacteria bacterium]|nr:metallophosphoesterase [Deltaproteobacteria bacterium]